MRQTPGGQIANNLSEPIRRRHHFLPAFHLAGFTNPSDNLLWVYDRLSRFAPRQTIPDATAWARDLYSIGEPENDTRADAFEKWIDTEIEQPATWPIQRMARGVFDLSRAERERVARYIALQDLRSPTVREVAVSTIAALVDQQTPAVIRRALTSNGEGEPDDDEIEYYRHHLTVDIQSTAWIAVIQEKYARHAEDLLKCKWSIIPAARDYDWFINDIGIVKCADTKGTPQSYEPNWEAGSASWLMPVSSRFALLVEARRLHLRMSESQWQKSINRQIVIDASSTVFSRRLQSCIPEWWRSTSERPVSRDYSQVASEILDGKRSETRYEDLAIGMTVVDTRNGRIMCIRALSDFMRSASCEVQTPRDLSGWIECDPHFLELVHLGPQTTIKRVSQVDSDHRPPPSDLGSMMRLSLK